MRSSLHKDVLSLKFFPLRRPLCHDNLVKRLQTGTRCTAAPGRLLPEPGGLVVSKCTCRGTGALCLLVECLYEQGPCNSSFPQEQTGILVIIVHEKFRISEGMVLLEIFDQIWAYTRWVLFHFFSIPLCTGDVLSFFCTPVIVHVVFGIQAWAQAQT